MQVLSTARFPQVEKVVVEETISPFAQSPLMVAMSTLQVRQGPRIDEVSMQVLTTAPYALPHRFVRDRATTRPWSKRATRSCRARSCAWARKRCSHSKRS